jgi:PAS domain S-box-containing protein
MRDTGQRLASDAMSGIGIRPAINTAPGGQGRDAFRLLVDSTLDYAIFMLTPEGFVSSWNRGAQRLKGYTPDEIIGQHFSVFYTAEARAMRWPQHELEVATREGRFEDDGWRLRKDGSRFWANVVITALRDTDGTLIGFGKVSRDLTERRAAEQHLRESEERFRLIIESTIDYAIFMLDPDGCVATWNPGAQRIKGYTADEIIGRHFSVFYPPDANERGWPAYELQEATRTGRFEDEGWRLRKDGSRFWANVVISALRDNDGSLRGFAKVTRDMSDRKAHEQRIELLRQELEVRVVELATTNRELAQKTAENESFVYSVSHDLRSPLVNLQGFSHELTLTSANLEALLSEPAVPPDIRDRGMSILSGEFAESIGFIRNAVRHLGNIIDGLLRLSRLGRVEYQWQSVDLSAIIANLLGAMHTSIVTSGARIEVAPLPLVEGDRNAIGQVFANLIGNALKSFDDNRPGVITISASDDDPPVFAIADNGIGIAPQHQRKLFQVFQQVHDTPRRGEGMGLAIVRRIVERHGGRIWLDSTPGVGTTFFFTLAPTAASSLEAAPPEAR